MTTELLNAFVSGAFMIACVAVALFYFRYWRRTRERLFLVLCAAFAMFAIERGVLAFVPFHLDGRHLIFFVRLAAYVLIIAGIVDKNWPRGRRPARAKRRSAEARAP
jgi:hypothetical protein